jgi:hypothetical protein
VLIVATPVVIGLVKWRVDRRSARSRTRIMALLAAERDDRIRTREQSLGLFPTEIGQRFRPVEVDDLIEIEDVKREGWRHPQGMRVIKGRMIDD